MRLALLCSVMLVTGAASAAEVWRWVDKDGAVHYGDTSRHGAQPLDVKSANGNGPDAATLAHTAECQKQKAELEGYRSAGVLQQQDALGNVHTFTEPERLKLLELTEQKVKAACGPPPAVPASPTAPAPLTAPTRP